LEYSNEIRRPPQVVREHAVEVIEEPKSSSAPFGLSSKDLDDYRTHGFVVLRGVFSSDEMDELRQDTDRLLNERQDLINPRNLRCRYMPHHETGESLFEVFDPVNDISPCCERFSLDDRILRIMETIYGEPAHLFKDKLIFKPPGALGYQLHQDIPRYWPGFPRSFLTVLIPIDRTTRENGCTEVYSGYHADFMSNSPEVYMLPDDMVELNRGTWLELAAGDIAIFHGLTPHRSGPNKSNSMRRTLYTSYNAASDGGDQRAAHYAEFHEKMRPRIETLTGSTAYFQ
jgi:ectoine hydroxylase-related dioxygenase (phytanoyl-CoA dioxygenase family)